MTIKVLKFLLKVEKWVLKHTDPDDANYKEYCETIKKNERTIELLERAGERNEID